MNWKKKRLWLLLLQSRLSRAEYRHHFQLRVNDSASFRGAEIFKILTMCAACLFPCQTFVIGLIQTQTSEDNFAVAWFANDWLEAGGLVTFPQQSLTERWFKQAWLGHAVRDRLVRPEARSGIWLQWSPWSLAPRGCRGGCRDRERERGGERERRCRGREQRPRRGKRRDKGKNRQLGKNRHRLAS